MGKEFLVMEYGNESVELALHNGIGVKLELFRVGLAEDLESVQRWAMAQVPVVLVEEEGIEDDNWHNHNQVVVVI